MGERHRVDPAAQKHGVRRRGGPRRPGDRLPEQALENLQILFSAPDDGFCDGRRIPEAPPLDPARRWWSVKSSPAVSPAGNLNSSARYPIAARAGWLPAGDVRIGITAGASTPDSVVGETIERILALRGRTAGDLTQPALIAQGSSTLAKATVDKQSFA